MKTIGRLVSLTCAALLVLTLLSLGGLSDTGRRDARAQDLQINIDEIVGSGFIHPVQVTHAGDGSDRLFVVEQPGTIRIIHGNGTVDPTPFLDLTALTDDSGEQGLLDLAFHPDYANNGYLYVNYTRLPDGATVVARYTVSSGDPDSVAPASAFTILTVPQPHANHNGGQVLFGPDGYLYIGMGDGGGSGDPDGNGQDPTTLLGTILRIDVDGGSPYAIPLGNPFSGTTGRDEIWAFGLRNPWRFSFDRVTGDLYIADVGQSAREEINFQASGAPGGRNYGWNCMEGTQQYVWDPACETAIFTDPIVEYDHSEGRRSVTGGFVYRGAQYPALEGRYFYGDYLSGQIWSFNIDDPAPLTPTLELDTTLSISAFGEDEAGEIYVVDRDGGTIRRIALAAGPFVPTHSLWLPVLLRR